MAKTDKKSKATHPNAQPGETVSDTPEAHSDGANPVGADGAAAQPDIAAAAQPEGDAADSKKKRKTEEPLEEVTAELVEDAPPPSAKKKASQIDIELDGEEDPASQSGPEQAQGGLSAELEAERTKYLRLAAEYDNFRKRSKLERETTYRDARTDAITRLLPVYDNLERALKTECSDEAFYKGIEMTMNNLTEILDSLDVKQIPAVGEPFDPNRHNAVMSIEDPELGEKIIAQEFQKGFMLGDKVIRFSTVVVAN